MAKAKLRRTKKELEKLRRSDNHIEWLVRAQDLPTTPELQHQTEQAWQEVQRRTLRTQEAFAEFCTHIPAIRNVPKTPELSLLLTLREIIKGETFAGNVLPAAAELPAVYQAARQALCAVMEAPLDRQGIEELLSLLASHPGKITRRHYHNLASHFTGTVLHQPLLALGEGMAVFRKLNHKTHLQKPLSESLLDDLDDAHHTVFTQTDFLPEGLRQLLFFPFAVQVISYLRDCEEKPADHRVKELIQFVSPVFLQGAEHLLTPELRSRLLSSDKDELSQAALTRMEVKFSSASFEEKLTLLRDLRHLFSAYALAESNDSFFPNLQDDETIWKLERCLLRFHRQLLRDIARQLPNRSPREGRELAAVMAPILADDVEALVSYPDNSQSLVGILLLAAELGFLNVRLSVMALILVHRDTGKRLGSLAAKGLREGPAPTLADLRWIMDKHAMPLLQAPTFLETLFEKIQDNAELVNNLAARLWDETVSLFMLHTFVPEITAAARLVGHPSPAMTPLSRTAIRDLTELANRIRPLTSLARFLETFPAGLIEAENLHTWLEHTWNGSNGCELFIDSVMPLIACASQSSGFLQQLGMQEITAALGPASGKLNLPKVLNEFLREHTDGFRRFSLKNIQILVEEVFPYLEGQSGHSSLLIKTYNILVARVSSGEKEFTALRNTLDDRIRAANSKRRPARSPRRRK